LLLRLSGGPKLGGEPLGDKRVCPRKRLHPTIVGRWPEFRKLFAWDKLPGSAQPIYHSNVENPLGKQDDVIWVRECGLNGFC